jgi:hypothetical protein
MKENHERERRIMIWQHKKRKPEELPPTEVASTASRYIPNNTWETYGSSATSPSQTTHGKHMI